MIDRRGFLSSFAGIAGAASTLGLPPTWGSLLEQEPPRLPDGALYGSNEEAYWTELRKQFLIPADEVYLNNGTVGSSPVPVLRAVFDGYNDTEKMAQSDPEDYPIWGYGAWNEFRDPLAEFVGCTRDELALVRNATEANSYIANGLDMKPEAGRRGLNDRPGAPQRRATLESAREAIWDRGEKDHAAEAGAECGGGAESFQRCDHSADARAVLQPHHHGNGRGLAGEGTQRASAFEGDSLGGRRRACRRHDEAQYARAGLRHVHLEPAQMAASAEG